MAEAIVINTKQKSVLKKIVDSGKIALDSTFDMRTVNALEARGLVKVKPTKAGTFAAPTAKGKKLLN